VSPRFGMLFDLPDVSGQIYANASRTFEPPLMLELNSLTVPGFIDIEGQSAWQFELGTRGRITGLAWDVAVSDVELRNEILNANVQPFPGAAFTVPTYRNAAKTRHYGLEAGLEYQIPGNLFTSRLGGDWLTLRGAYTFAQYRFVEDSTFEGNDIPGAPHHQLSAELRYSHPSGFSLGPIIEWVPGTYFVDSGNTTTNRGWFLLSARADWDIGSTGLSAFLQARNLTDTNRATSVQVDNANGRYYEPVDGRSIYAGLRFSR
ncbi:MAG: TonB-dependent receptor domain-containing protein, partial [Gemmatimonadales bacterium]